MVKTVTISMTPSGKYFASVLVDTAIQELPASTIQGNTTLGIDLGIKSLAVCSDGRTFDNPKNLQRSLDRLKLLQKRLSRKQIGSANRNKARILVARLQEHIANCRKDNLHKITYALTHESQVRTICMEHLNVKGMQRNHHLTQAVGDASFGMFLTMLEYKCRWYGVNLIKIDRFAPSSKTCSQCGYIFKLVFKIILYNSIEVFLLCITFLHRICLLCVQSHSPLCSFAQNKQLRHNNAIQM